MKVLNISLFLLIAVCDLATSKKKQKSVTTVIDAKWETTPLVLEMAEFLADENEFSFWEFVDQLSDLTPALSESG